MQRFSCTWGSTLGFLCISLALWIRATSALPLDSDWSDAREMLAVSRLGQSLRGAGDEGAVSGGQSVEEDGEDPLEEPMYRARRVPLSLLMKRALSLFTRWRPNQGSGATRYAVPPGNDFVSAVARDSSRPRGQPLRWG